VSVWAIIPAKSFDEAKSRLASVLDGAQRAELARRLLGRVVSACRGAKAVDEVLVLTDSDAVATWVAEGVRTLPDPPDAAVLSDVVDHALRSAAGRGADQAIVLMGDLPRIEPADVDALIAHIRPGRVVLCADATGVHTNALGVSLPAPMATAFGSADSRRAHVARARAAGQEPIVVDAPRLAFDVDTPDDYARLVALDTRAAPAVSDR
jgi:2-phospho-L-lactate guanylyltransferase